MSHRRVPLSGAPNVLCKPLTVSRPEGPRVVASTAGFRIALDEVRNLRFRSVRLLDDSYFESVQTSPYPLDLVLPAKRIDGAVAGGTFEVPYRLTTHRAQPLRDVVVMARPGNGLTVVGPRERTISTLTKLSSGQFAFRSEAPGTYRFEFRAVGSLNTRVAVAEVDVIAGRHGRSRSVHGPGLPLPSSVSPSRLKQRR